MHYNADTSYLSVNGKKNFKSKADNKNANFPTRFCLESISDGFSNIKPRKASLNENVYDFSADYYSIDKPDILNIHMYLITENNIKECIALSNKCLLYYQVIAALWYIIKC